MEPTQNYSANNYAEGSAVEQEILPKSVAVLVMGILSINFAFAYGIPGIVLAIIALNFAGKSKSYLLQNPGFYTQGSIKMLHAGRTCAIIGLIVSIVMVFVFIFFFAFLFSDFSHHRYNPYY